MSETPSNTDRTAERPPSERSHDWVTALGGHRPNSLDDVRETYEDQAETMARMDVLNRLLTGRYRRDLFGRATGRVLDVACGVGTNRRYLPETVEYLGVDLSPAVLRQAERRLGLEPGSELLEMDAQSLAFPDDSFDTVVSSMSTCTFPDPLAALAEMNRVCEPGGRVLLLEHGRSDVELLGRFQDWRADAHYEKHSCRWNQEPADLVSRSALSVREASTGVLGLITAIEAEPT